MSCFSCQLLSSCGFRSPRFRTSPSSIDTHIILHLNAKVNWNQVIFHFMSYFVVYISYFIFLYFLKPFQMIPNYIRLKFFCFEKAFIFPIRILSRIQTLYSMLCNILYIVYILLASHAERLFNNTLQCDLKMRNLI